MKILLTGANGYVGKRLLFKLVEEGHTVFALVRNKQRFPIPKELEAKVHILQGDLEKYESLSPLSSSIDAAYFLVHALSVATEDFIDKEQKIAINFIHYIHASKVRQIIYLSGLASNKESSLHLKSRFNVEKILRGSGIPLTVLRAGIVIGSGSASFEIMRDLVEKLPLMITPKWVMSKCQPISIVDVLDYLVKVLDNRECKNKTFDIGGPDVLTYKSMLLEFAKVRKLKRWIITVPVLTTRLSSYWLYFVTATNFSIAKWLVDSLKQDAICSNNEIEKIIPKKCISYKESIEKAFSKIGENAVISSWKDSFTSSMFPTKFIDYIEVPKHGCLKDEKSFIFKGDSKNLRNTIWKIGGKNGWYAYNFLWKMRGGLDKLFGGVGLRRGRRHPNEISPGDALDFWRVLLADKKNMRLLLYAEMKLPGEAWLEFHIEKQDGHCILHQTATFRPKGLLGRIYWYILFPIHHLIFRKMGRNIIKRSTY
ncbi:MAG: DUF2867 domain-containing protein [Chlamydiae bacterium CG10_big_fil_rev_8_21_14_0_10_35_9]|nr:MAG: DUF2867 domain-containing protein [Chlamydiae bacterium CG10_big_fil_rev_8_21_14_0_10_35_9]